MSEIHQMSDSEYEQWLQQMCSEHLGNLELTERNLLALVSNVIREESPVSKAQMLLDLANFSMAMADKTLGNQGSVTTAVELMRH